MEKSRKKIIYIYILLSWALTILALVFRILARVYAYDSDIGYFKSGSVFSILHYVSLFLIALLAFSSFFLFRRSAIPESILLKMKQTCVMEKIAAVVGGISMLTVSVYMALLFWGADSALTPTSFTSIGLLTAFLSVFFFLFFWIPTRIGKNAHIFSGFALILHFVYILVSSYSELYTTMNNPVKILTQLTAIAAILYLLSDLRFYLGTALPARYIAFATIFLGLATVSSLSCGMFEVHRQEYTELYRLYNLTCFSLVIPSAVRLTRFFMLWIQSERALDDCEIDADPIVAFSDESISDDSDLNAPSDVPLVDEPENTRITEEMKEAESEDAEE